MPGRVRGRRAPGRRSRCPPGPSPRASPSRRPLRVRSWPRAIDSSVNVRRQRARWRCWGGAAAPRDRTDLRRRRRRGPSRRADAETEDAPRGERCQPGTPVPEGAAGPAQARILAATPVWTGCRPVLGSRPLVLGDRPSVLGDRSLGFLLRTPRVFRHSVVFGDRPLAFRARSQAIGTGSLVLGDPPPALGESPTVLGDRPPVFGDRTLVLGECSPAFAASLEDGEDGAGIGVGGRRNVVVAVGSSAGDVLCSAP